MKLQIEKITEQHRNEVIDIFNYYIENSTAAYRAEVVDYSFFDNLLEDCIGDSKYVAKADGKVAGFFFLEYFMPLKTFSEAAEVSYFFSKECVGKGFGKIALTVLEDDAKKNGIKTLVANIASDNIDSIRFHEKNGFTKYGELKDVGLKFNRYFNIVYMNKSI